MTVTTQGTARAALYSRLSNRPGESKIMTVAEQEKILRRTATTLGFDVVGAYCDNGVSAYKRVRRPGFGALLESIEAGEITHVLVTALDRASRRVADVAALLETCETAEVLLVVDGRVLDPGDDSLQLYLGAVVGHEESRVKARRVKRAKDEALERGLYQGGRRPFGYRKVEGAAPGWWAQDPAEADAIRTGADMLLAGASLIDVAKAWNRSGLRTSSASNPFNASKVRRALASPIVAGLRTNKGEVVGPLCLPNGEPWDAILTPDERDAVARVLRSRYSGTEGVRWHSARPALLSGIIRCAGCGHAMSPRRYNGRRADAYTCQSDGGDRCGTVGVTAHYVEADVTAAVLAVLSDSVKLRKAMAKPTKPAKRQGENPADLQRDLDDLAGAAGRGELPTREWLIARKPLEARLKAARAADTIDDRATVLTPFEADPLKAWASADLERKRLVIAALLDRVEVSKAVAHVYDRRRLKLVWKA